MNTAVAERSAGTVVSIDDFRATRAEMIGVLQSSLYPGAKPESVEMVLGYCTAAGLDVMQKPVHIVPMKVKTGKKDNYGNDQYENRDVVMPGVGLYRVQASRTGQYAGMDAPEFGPNKEFAYSKKVREWVDGENGKRKPIDKFENAVLVYPEWCRVTVYRLVNGARCPFPAVEFWTENYATASSGSDAPNAMWERRPRGQLVKCAEAQALRKAFPDAVGSAPTAEEMEGRYHEVETIAPENTTAKTETVVATVAETKEPPARPPCTPETFAEKFPSWRDLIESGKKTHKGLIGFLETKYALTDEQKATINKVEVAP